jgi:protein-arginine kinase activator protein McsA
MKCVSCGKEPATVHLTEIVGKEKQEQHLCDDCAESLARSLSAPPTVKCGSCGERPATVHLIGFTDGEREERHLCEECARSSAASPTSGLTAADVFKRLLKWVTRTETRIP